MLAAEKETEAAGGLSVEDADPGLTMLQKTRAFAVPFAVVEDRPGDVDYVSGGRNKSEMNRTFVNHYLASSEESNSRGQTRKLRPNMIKATGSSMGAVLGFQGAMAGQLSSASRSAHSHGPGFDEAVLERANERPFNRRRDDFSAYVEAKARNPQLAGGKK
jgi:hypothetical protein